MVQHQMNKIYIITKEGRAYSAEGKRHVYYTLYIHLGLNRQNETVFVEGCDQNRFDHFIESVRNDLENGHEVFAFFSSQDDLPDTSYILNFRALEIFTECAALASDTDEPLSDTWEIMEAMVDARNRSEEDAQEGDTNEQ